jgi:hypothetical protein
MTLKECMISNETISMLEKLGNVLKYALGNPESVRAALVLLNNDIRPLLIQSLNNSGLANLILTTDLSQRVKTLLLNLATIQSNQTAAHIIVDFSIGLLTDQNFTSVAIPYLVSSLNTLLPNTSQISLQTVNRFLQIDAYILAVNNINASDFANQINNCLMTSPDKLIDATTKFL